MIALQVLQWIGMIMMAFTVISLTPVFPVWAGLGKKETSKAEKTVAGAVVAGWVSVWFFAIKGLALGWIDKIDYEAGAGLFALAFLIGGLCFNRICNLHRLPTHKIETPLARAQRQYDAPLVEQGRLSTDVNRDNRLQARFIPQSRRTKND